MNIHYYVIFTYYCSADETICARTGKAGCFSEDESRCFSRISSVSRRRQNDARRLQYFAQIAGRSRCWEEAARLWSARGKWMSCDETITVILGFRRHRSIHQKRESMRRVPTDVPRRRWNRLVLWRTKTETDQESLISHKRSRHLYILDSSTYLFHCEEKQ